MFHKTLNSKTIQQIIWKIIFETQRKKKQKTLK